MIGLTQRQKGLCYTKSIFLWFCVVRSTANKHSSRNLYITLIISSSRVITKTKCCLKCLESIL